MSKRNSNINRFALVSLAFFLLISGVALAADAPSTIYEHDYVVNTYEIRSDFFFSISTSQVSACRCDTTAIYLTIQNRGTHVESFSIHTNNPRVTFSEPAVLLAPAEQKILIGYLNAPCDAGESEELYVEVKAASGLDKSATLPVHYQDCQNLAAEFTYDNFTTQVCEPVTNILTISNIGNHVETYTIGVDKHAKDIQIASNTVTLSPQTSTEIPVVYALSCNVYGEQNITYTITAQGSQLAAELSQFINVTPNYEFAITADDEIAMCAEDDYVADVFINNFNDFTNEFILELDAPDFIKLDMGNATSVILGAQESTKIPLKVTAANEHGYYNVTLTATSVFGDVVQTLNINVTLANCYEFGKKMSFPPKRIASCAGDEFSYNVTIEHKGAALADIELVITGPDFVTAGEVVQTLQPNTTNNIELNFTIPTGVNDTYPIDITAYHRGEEIDSGKFKLFVEDEYICYELKQKKDTIKVKYDAKGFALPVQNIGERYGEYSVRTSDMPSYLFADQDSITLGKTQKGVVSFTINEAFLKHAAISSNNGSVIGMSATPTITLTNELTGATFDMPFVVLFEDYPWYTKVWRGFVGIVLSIIGFLATLPVCIIVLLAALLVLVLLIIVLIVQKTVQKRTFRFNTGFATVAAIIWIILLLATFGVYGLPTGQELYTAYDLSQDTTTYIQLAEDTKKHIDASVLFFDPDGDIEEYGVYAIDEGIFKHKTRGEIIVLKPGKDWFGQSSMQLFATDAFNETAISQNITLEVLPVEDYSFKQFVFIFCEYIVLIVLLVVGIAMVCIASMRPRKQ